MCFGVWGFSLIPSTGQSILRLSYLDTSLSVYLLCSKSEDRGRSKSKSKKRGPQWIRGLKLGGPGSMAAVSFWLQSMG